MSIYTRSGDEGVTSLLGGSRVSKSDPIFEVLGTLDELNSSLGLLSSCRIREINSTLLRIQNELFSIGATVAGISSDNITMNSDTIEKKVRILEKEIDSIDSTLEPLSNFILPGGTSTSSKLHHARSICRRLERTFVIYLNTLKTELSSGNDLILNAILKYINRLSDLLFVLARFANKKNGVKDIPWIKEL